ncbi:MAG: type II secretion system protein [Deltaproteobacteria bacterium]|nr:type II secretion system protein [Deltaproteobacteria bacterium]
MADRQLKINRILKGQYGFTLLEILATFVLMAIILPAAMKGISISSKMAGHSKKKVEASALAEAKLTEIIINKDWTDGEQEGDFEDEWADYSWSMTVEDWEKEESMQQVDLSVFWNTSGIERSVTLTTVVYN